MEPQAGQKAAQKGGEGEGEVGTGSAIEKVISITATDPVVLGATVDLVVLGATKQAVESFTTVDDVVTGFSVDGVVPSPPSSESSPSAP